MPIWNRFAAAMTAVAFLFLPPSPTTASPSATPGPPLGACQPDWTVVPSPNNGTLLSRLEGASTLAADDAWAVGHYRNPSFRDLTLAEHWDGAAWTIVPTPNVAADANYLYDVDASSASDAWAVGEHGSGPYKPLIERWNGTSWSISNSPSFAGDAITYGVTTLAPDDAWAVGYQFTTFAKTLIEHWNGSSWNVVPSPSPTSSNSLVAISALSPTDIWAVGTKWTTSQRPLTLHWDGTSWTEVPSPDLGLQTIVNGVVAVSSTDVWLVGQMNAGAYTQHWDGVQWSWVSAPFGTSSLDGVTASSSDTWAVGNFFDGLGQDTLVIHWDGAAWSQVPSPNPSSSFNLLLAADSADGQIWAVGTNILDGYEQTLIETACPISLSITEFFPPSGAVGSAVTITGTGFTDVTSVAFNGVIAPSYVVDSPTKIRAKVPLGATTGPISVTSAQGMVQSQSSFRVKPKITGFMPTSGPIGTVVTIHGSAFQGATSVAFNGVEASFSVMSYSKIRATVPVGATTGPITVTTPDGRSRSRTDYVVT
jgi:hypothetical protein